MTDLQGRGKALENLFFGNRDHDLLEKLRQEIEGKEVAKALAAVSGIDDEAALEKLISVGVAPETLAAVSLIPLVVVAWSDRSVAAAEKDAILKAASSSGIESGSAAFELLNGWLADNPGSELAEAWKVYIASLKDSLDGSAFGQLKTSVMNRAQAVAEAAGGFLGINTVSEAEKLAIDELKQAFG